MSLTPLDGFWVSNSSESAIVTLPPGLTLDQFQDLERSKVIIAITNAVVIGILIWDYLLLLPDEIKLYRVSTREMWSGPAMWSFVILRYSGFVAISAALFFTVAQSGNCQTAVAVSQLGAVLVNVSSGIIFGYRVCAMWAGKQIINLLVAFMYLVMVASWVAVASQYQAVNGPMPLVGSNCQILPLVSWAPLCYAASFAFNSVILILTIWKLCDHRYTRSPVGSIILRDSLIYFFFTTTTNLTVLSIQSLGKDMDYMKPAAVPFATLITTTMGCRLFLNLKLFGQRTESGLASHSKTMDEDEYEYKQRSSPVPKPLILGSHSRQSSTSSNAPTYVSHANDRTVDHNRGLPSIPTRPSVPADVYMPPHRDEESHGLMKDEHR